MPIISAKNITKTFSFYKKPEGLSGSLKAFFIREKLQKHAVKNVSFSIDEGEFIGFIGPNGAGKTTTLKMLSGILTPTSGTLLVAEHIPEKREDIFKRKISLVMGQKSQIWPTLPPIETFHFIQAMYDIPETDYRTQVKELSELLDITSVLHVQARKLSLGQRMKCELIASLLHSPRILFLDEPTIGLDVVSQKHIWEFLTTYNKQKKATIILTSHYMDDIKNLCKRILIINDGSLIFDGELNDIISRYSDHKLIQVSFSKAITKKDISKLGTILSFSPYAAEISIPIDSFKERVTRLITAYPVNDLTIHDIALEEIIADIFTKNTVK